MTPQLHMCTFPSSADVALLLDQLSGMTLMCTSVPLVFNSSILSAQDTGTLKVPATSVGVGFKVASVSSWVVSTCASALVRTSTPRISSADFPMVFPFQRDLSSLEYRSFANSRTLLPETYVLSFPSVPKMTRVKCPSTSTKIERTGHSI